MQLTGQYTKHTSQPAKYCILCEVERRETGAINEEFASRENTDKIIKVFHKRKQELIFYCNKVFSGILFTNADKEEMVDEALIRTLKSPQAIKGFNNNDHIIKYLKVAIRSRFIRKYFTSINSIKKTPLPADFMKRNYDLARDIIDSHRVVKNKKARSNLRA